MLTFPTNNLFIEGSDCSGKTTLVKTIHGKTNYRWHIHDRSQVSRSIFADMYNRSLPNLSSDLHLELSNLNNRYIFLVPERRVVQERFNKRGDEIHDKKSLMDVWTKFSNASREYADYPNVLVIPFAADAF